MADIFDDAFAIIADFCKTAWSRLQHCRKSYKITCYCIVAALAVFVSLYASGVTVAYRVNFHGKTIATVKSQAEFTKAVTVVEKTVNGKGVSATICKPVYTTAVVLDNELDDPETVAQSIIDNTNDIVLATAFFVSGKQIGYVEGDTLQAELDAHRNRFNVPGAECVSEFTDLVETEVGYYLKKDTVPLSDVAATIETLQVKTVAAIETESEVPYSRITVSDPNQLRGYSRVTVKGEPGQQYTLENVTFINGTETERVTVKSYVTNEPIDEEVIVGTAKSIASANERAIAKNSGFLFPLPRGVAQVSAYFGDGRNHRGIDLACPKGTNIFAVYRGTVIFAGWDGQYGNCIVIDHGNGKQTRYAHASQLLVKLGETVSQGQVIAKVGSTGRSTGNHLHFEVLLNGKRVDPAPYIGLS